VHTRILLASPCDLLCFIHPARFAHAPSTLNREGQGDLTDMIAALQNGTYTALILDAPVLEHIVGTNDACDLFLVGTAFESFSLALAFPALAFPAAFDDALLYEFSNNIVKLQVCPGAWGPIDRARAAGHAASGEAAARAQVTRSLSPAHNRPTKARWTCWRMCTLGRGVQASATITKRQAATAAARRLSCARVRALSCEPAVDVTPCGAPHP
jgi:hypothetical protein